VGDDTEIANVLHEAFKKNCKYNPSRARFCLNFLIEFPPRRYFLWLRFELLYDGKDGRTDFNVVLRQCKVRMHFSVVGVGEFSAGFRTVIVDAASIIVAQERTGCLLQAIESIGVEGKVLGYKIPGFHFESSG